MSSSKRVGMMYTGCHIPLHTVITFPQVRQTFEESLLQELADDIAQNGVLQPSIVGKLSYESFVLYKETFEAISGLQLSPIEEYPIHEGYYFCLIAGERRYRAHKVLWDMGCSECKRKAKEKKRVLVPGACYKKHFPDKTIEVRSCLNIDPLSAKSIQYRENNYVKPPAHEEAHSYEQYYRYQKRLNPKLTFTQFAVILGISVERVKNALWFCELPQTAQVAVKQKIITYTNALELKQILTSKMHPSQKEALIAKEVEYLMLHPRVKNDDYKKRVREIISNRNQETLFSLEEFTITAKGKRKVVMEHLIPQLTLANQYAKKVAFLLEQGVLGKELEYSGISPSRQLIKIVDNIQLCIPDFFSEEQLEKIKQLDLEKGVEVLVFSTQTAS